ncbi:winged helix-turn-helix domain-containing protein [Streptomyces sp. NPDC055105]|uniref:winged helix-turn-helix domain-containing protein n=1 Tax=Streptomyces sp. NPDC055105 TaxID=3365719 RepID=UPI0037D70528
MPETTGYAEIAEHLRQQIQDGTLRPGDTMPSYKKTAAQYGVAITTVNRAFKLLKAEGLTVAKPGVGTVVAEPSPHDQIVQMSRDLVEIVNGEPRLTETALKYADAAHRFYEESGAHALDSAVAQETCSNLAYAYSILARRAAEQLEGGDK